MVNEERIAMFLAVLEKDPESDFVRFGLGNLYLEAGQYENAIEQFHEAIRIKPSYSMAYLNLGKACQEAGQKEEAKAIWQKGLQVADENGDLMVKNQIVRLLQD